MKSTSLFLALFLIAANISFSQDVRKLSWGMSTAEVKRIEGPQKYVSQKSGEGLEFFYYTTTINALDCTIAFYFVDNKLWSVVYLFEEKHSEQNLYKDDFLDICFILDDKYGKAKVERYWSNELYKDNPERWGLAIAAGHLMMYTDRDLEKTKISHTLDGDNFQITHKVSFKSKELRTVAAEKQKKKSSSDF